MKNAFRQAFQMLPQEEYDWFDMQGAGRKTGALSSAPSETESGEELVDEDQASAEAKPAARQKHFFEFHAEAVITVTSGLFEQPADKTSTKKGLPAYTFISAPGELWRSRYDRDKNLVEINKGHRDFIFAGQNKTRKLRYISRLFSKELVLDNFPGLTAAQLLEHMVELSLYAEEHL